MKEAFGHRTGFLAIWLLWIENVIWYPTVLSFIAATLAYVFDPALSNSPLYTLCIVLLSFWGATWANLKGMKVSSMISSFGMIFGTFVTGGLIILLGLIWYFQGNPIQITMSWETLIPNMESIDQMVLFTGIMFTLCGMEMSAIHAKDVQDPQKNYPKAILLSVIIILGMSILGVLSIASVIPQSQISLVAGSMQAFSYFVNAYNLSWMTPYIAALIAVGAFASMSTWLVGPPKGLLAAAQAGDLPPYFRAVNKKGMPTRLLVTQGIIVTLFSLVFLFTPSVSTAFWVLSATVAEIYLIMLYLLLFAAAIKLRYKKASVPRAYRVPGGKIGMWIVSGAGTLTCLFAMGIGFFPPAQIQVGNVFLYECFLILGVTLSCAAPSIILLFQKPSWKKQLEHERE